MNSERQKKQHNKKIDGNPQKDYLGEAFERDIRPFIEVIDNLRKHGLQNDIKLPNVVVVGDQSSGKSSIIEALSGVQLPRGRGIVTRCPLELQLKRMRNNITWKGTLSYKGKEKDINHPKDVEGLIKLAQNEICNSEIDISEELLTLRIESNAPNAPELTLIDLPGIARTVMDGQSKDICSRIKKIIEKFVKNENTVILCMVSANLDVAVNESLNVAKEFDPDNERTLGVITKPDLAEDHQKEMMLRLLNNEIFKLKKGYRMVKCRSHEELENQTSLNESLASEIAFFQNDNYFRNAEPSLLGTMNLASKITKELVTVIKKTIPKLKRDIQFALDETRKELYDLPKEVPEGEGEKRFYLLSIFNEMINGINIMLTTGEIENENIYQISRKLFVEFQTQLKAMQQKAIMNNFNNKSLQIHITEKRGREICGFLDHKLFEDLISEHIQQYSFVSQELLHKIKEKTEDSLLKLIKKIMKNPLSIRNDIAFLISQTVENYASKAQEHLLFILDQEKMVFAMDSVFQDQMKNMFGTNQSDSLSLEDNAAMLNQLMQCYLKVVLNRLCDSIPMAIRQWLHIKLNNDLKESLMVYVADDKNLEKVRENNYDKNKRQRLYDKLRRLNMAKQSLFQF